MDRRRIARKSALGQHSGAVEVAPTERLVGLLKPMGSRRETGNDA